MTPALKDALRVLEQAVALSPRKNLLLEGREVLAPQATRSLQQFVHSRFFCRRKGAVPPKGRASGDSAWVYELSNAVRGAVAWEPGFKVTQAGGTWVFVSNGRISLFLDEPGQVLPTPAKEGQAVSVRLPRLRENLHPYRMTVRGGRGGVSGAEPFSKLFVSVNQGGAVSWARHLVSRGSEKLAFEAALVNAPDDYDRLDTLVVDVPRRDEEAVTRWLREFARTHVYTVRVGTPLFAAGLDVGISCAAGTLGPEDVADGYGKRQSGALADAVWEGVLAGEKTGDDWNARLMASRRSN